MINFIDEKGVKHSAVVECKKTKGVNGEKSLSGTIYTNDEILEGIGRGWRLEFENEKYCLTYVYPIDEGKRIVVEFDAVHEFFFDLNKKVVYTELNGSNTAKAYLDLIFNGSGYSYLIEVNIPAFEKEGFGMRNRLDLFKEFVSDTGVEFSVNGKVVRILEKVGSNLSTIVKKGFNLNELRIEKDPGSFITYKKGFGAWHDDDDHSKGRLEVEYLSPLASIYGKLEGDPIVDERYKVASNFETRLKNDVESSYGISVDVDMEDLTKAGYEYEQPHEGDYIMAINKDLGFEQKIRIMSYETSYDTNGNIIDHKIACGSDNIIRKSKKEDDDFRKEIQAGLEGAISTSNKAWVSANGKNAVFEGPDEPTATAIGDTWFQIDGDKKIMRIWNGYEWKPVFNPGEIENKIDQAEKDIAQNIIDIESALDKATQAELDAGFSKDLAGEAKALGITASSLAGEATTNANTAMADALEAIRQVELNGGVVADASADATEAKRLAGLAEGNSQEALTKANASVTDASKALTDATKAFNKSFKSSTVAYATSTNGNTPPTTGWASTHATPSPDVYIWTRTTIVLNDNTSVVSYSVGKIGAKGDQGLKGDPGAQGAPGANAPTITSVEQQFYLSTSKSTQTGGSWLATVPVWSSGKYYWVRVATTYSNGATTTSTPVLDNALNDSLVTALEVKTANQNLSTTVSQHATLIEGKANSTTVDAIAGRVSTAEGSISTIAGQVALKANTTDVQTLTGRVSTAEGNITTQAGQIALKANTTDVNTLTGRVATAEGKITTQAGQIELKANQSVVDTLTGRVSTTESKIVATDGKVTTLTTKTDGHTTSIGVLESSYSGLNSTVTQVKNNLEGMEIGSRNLILNSQLVHTSPNDSGLGNATLMEDESTPYYRVIGNGQISTYGFDGSATSSRFSEPMIDGATYTVSVDVRAPRAGIVGLYAGIGLQPLLRINEWVRIKYTYTYYGTSYRVIGLTYNSSIIDYKNWKIERGNKATDWTPAPEDYTTVQAFSALEQNLSGFKTTVANTYADKTTVTQLSTQWTTTTNLVNGHTSQIASLGTDINLRATKTEFADALGSINLITNGGNMQSTAGWRGPATVTKHPYYKGGTENTLFIAAAGTSEVTVGSERFKIEPDTTYTLKFHGFASANVLSMDVFLLSRKAGSTADYDKASLLLTTKLDATALDTRTITFKTNATDKEAYIRFDNNGSTNGTSAGLYLVDIVLVKGSIAPARWFESTADSIVSQINISPESILIASKKIQIKGDTYIDNGIIKTAHIADLAVSGAKIANASIASAKIISLDASKITANTLSAITTDTGALNVSGWLTTTTENYGFRGTYNYGDELYGAYNPRWFDGDYRLSHRYLTFQANVYDVNSNNTRGAFKYYGETFYGADYLKLRQYTSSTNKTIRARVDVTADSIIIGPNFNGAQSIILNSNATSFFAKDASFADGITVNSQNQDGVRTGRINAPMNYNTLILNNNRNLGTLELGYDTSRYLRAKDVYDRTYSLASNMIVTDAGTLGRATSARKYKTNIVELKEIYSKAKDVLQIQPVTWLDKRALIETGTEQRGYGFIADEFHELGLKEVVQYGTDGQVEGLAYDRISMYHNVILQDHEQQLKRLDSITSNVIKLVANDSIYGLRLNNLESEVCRLKKRIEELEKIA